MARISPSRVPQASRRGALLSVICSPPANDNINLPSVCKLSDIFCILPAPEIQAESSAEGYGPQAEKGSGRAVSVKACAGLILSGQSADGPSTGFRNPESVEGFNDIPASSA
ncbi:MAG: hypothetical protein ABIG11_08900, partial [bacterium]